MSAFYKKRLASHRTQMMKYMKYVLNDHFILVMIIGMGGFGLYYSEFVKTLDPSFVLGKVIGILLCVISVFIGKLATLMKEADSIFLLPKERQMLTYLKASLKHSIVIPFVVIALITGVLMPLFVATSHVVFTDYYLLVLNLWGLKLAHLMIQLQEQYLNTEKRTQWQLLGLMIVSVTTVSLNVIVMPWLGLPITLVFLLVVDRLSRQSIGVHPLNWEKSIHLERKRLKKIYSFINLFTDVPGLATDVKRRPYLDGLLNRIKKEQGQTYRYLYSRVFLRGTEYSGLVMRLTIIGSLILIFSDQMMLNGIVGALFIYLIGFQLLPMYNEFDYMLMTQLYPVKSSQKVEAVQSIIRVILLTVAILFSLILVVTLEDKLVGLGISALLIVESLLFVQIYAAKRLKKMEKSLI